MLINHRLGPKSGKRLWDGLAQSYRCVKMGGDCQIPTDEERPGEDLYICWSLVRKLKRKILNEWNQNFLFTGIRLGSLPTFSVLRGTILLSCGRSGGSPSSTLVGDFVLRNGGWSGQEHKRDLVPTPTGRVPRRNVS